MIRLTIILATFFAVAPFLGAADDSFILTTFEKHCVKCHGRNGKVKGKINLLEIENLTNLGHRPDLLATLIDVIDFEEMPPEDEPPIDPDKRARFLEQLRTLRHQSLSANSAFNSTPIRRMNRFQYDNAVVDLFALNSVVYSLPERMMREHHNYFKPETGKMADTVTVGSRPLGKSQMIEKRLGGVTPFPQDLRAEHGYDHQGGRGSPG